MTLDEVKFVRTATTAVDRMNNIASKCNRNVNTDLFISSCWFVGWLVASKNICRKYSFAPPNIRRTEINVGRKALSIPKAQESIVLSLYYITRKK